MMNTILLVACGAMSQQVHQRLPGHRVIVCEDITGLNAKGLTTLADQVRQAVEEEDTPLEVVKAFQLLYPREDVSEPPRAYQDMVRVVEHHAVATTATDEYYLERASLKRLRKQQQHQSSK